MIPLSVLGGYLGAGKTTILNNLLNADHGRRIAVLLNDFGAVNIDSALVDTKATRKQDVPILELSNGCVCCRVQDDLGVALESIREARIDHAIIEASGVALPGKIADYGNTWPGYRLAGTLVAVDASNIEKQRTDKFIRHLVTDQIAQADLLLVTKLDLMPPRDAQIVLDSLLKPYVQSVNGDLPFDLLLDPPAVVTNTERAGALPEHPHFLAFNAIADGPVEREAIAKLLQALPSGVVRGKGWFHDKANKPWLVQCVGDRRTITPWEASRTVRGTSLLFVAVTDHTPPDAIASLIGQATGADSVSWS
ncbi:MAG: GTP-binding protein [Pseudomonadales bacterium]|jgi:G3E family GTPase